MDQQGYDVNSLLEKIAALEQENATLLKRVSNQSTSSEFKLLTSIIEKLHDGVVMQHEGKVVYANERVKSFAGLPDNELTGRSAHDFINPRYYEGIYNLLVSEDNIDTRFIPVVIDGKEVLLEKYSSKLELDGKEYRVITLRDLSARQLMEVEQYKSGLDYMSIFENAPTAIVIHDRETNNVVFLNKEATSLFKVLPEELIGKSLCNYCVEQDDCCTFLEKVAAEKRISNHEVTMLNNYKKEFTALVDAQVVDYQGRPSVIFFINDITERKEIERMNSYLVEETQSLNETLSSNEAELRRVLSETITLKDEIENSRLHYKALLDNSPDVYTQVNKKMELEYLHFPGANESWINQLIGRSMFDVMTRVDPHYVAAKIQGVFQSGVIDRYEIQGPDAFGNTIWYDTMLIPIRNDKGQITSVYCVSRDVSAKKESDKTLKMNEAKLTSLFESSSDSFILFDTSFNIIWFNREASKFVKETSGAIMAVGMPAYEIMLPDFKENYYIGLRKAVSGEIVNLERHIVQEGKDDYWMEVKISPVYDQQGELTGVAANLVNISERKKNELMLKDREGKLKAIFDSSRHIQYLLDPNGCLLWLNKPATESFMAMGYGKLKMGDRFSEFLPAEQQDFFNSIITNCLKGETFHQEVQTTRNGEEVWFEVIFRPCYDADGHLIGIFHVSWEISDRKFIEAGIQKSNELLFQQNRQLNQYSHIVSHNLRGPVASLLGLTTLLQMGNSTDLDQGKMVESVQKAALQLDKIINDLNEILSVTQEVEQVNSQIRLDEIVGDIRLLLKGNIDLTQAAIEVDFTQLNEIESVKSFVYSIFQNLISNALKYKKPDVAPIIKISSELKDGFAVISFEDNGLGIDMVRNREKLFLIYKRFHANIEGKGLGLHLVKSHAEMLGGRVEVESEVDKGTIFRVYLKV